MATPSTLRSTMRRMHPAMRLGIVICVSNDDFLAALRSASILKALHQFREKRGCTSGNRIKPQHAASDPIPGCERGYWDKNLLSWMAFCALERLSPDPPFSELLMVCETVAVETFALLATFSNVHASPRKESPKGTLF